MSNRLVCWFISVVVVGIGTFSCSRLQPSISSGHQSAGDANAQPGAVAPSMSDDQPLDYAGLHNVVAYGKGLYSGSVPDGTEGFQTLKAMGVRTIISVDGAKPDLTAARAQGMRYVHLPIGYNGMSDDRTLEIARAVRDLPGPIYLHCHHGKHRSAGAAGAAAVTLGMLSAEQAEQRMHVSGTAANYTGLFACVENARVASDRELQRASDAFPEVWKTSGLVQSMVEMDEVFENLKAIEQAGWRTPPDHPDLVPVAEAGRLADLLRTLHDHDDVRSPSHTEEFRTWLASDAQLAQALEDALLRNTINREALSEQFAAIGQSCKSCHEKYRDR